MTDKYLSCGILTDAEKGSGWVCRHCSRRFMQKHMYISHLMGHGLSDKEVQLEFTGKYYTNLHKFIALNLGCNKF